jgi:hypothetical protein
MKDDIKLLIAMEFQSDEALAEQITGLTEHLKHMLGEAAQRGMTLHVALREKSITPADRSDMIVWDIINIWRTSVLVE